MNSIKIGKWELRIEDGRLPSIFDAYLENAEFVDQIDIDTAEGRFLFIGVLEGESKNGWPSVILAQKYQDHQRTFSPGILVAPDTSLVFVGAGERLLCYDVKRRIRLWEDRTNCGFWGWYQTGSYILMSAELEFGVWKQSGEKLWSTFVEPPWSFEVKGQIVELDVMGNIRNFQLLDGVHIN